MQIGKPGAFRLKYNTFICLFYTLNSILEAFNWKISDTTESFETGIDKAVLNEDNRKLTLLNLDCGGAKNAALEESVNTEAFASPKSELITSSPKGDDLNNNYAVSNEREANVLHVSEFFRLFFSIICSCSFNETFRISIKQNISLTRHCY